MNLKTPLVLGCLVAALSTGASALAADGHCSMPLLYATNVRPHCEQLGKDGLKALVTGSMMFEQMLNRPHIADVYPAKRR
jgi:hypothetical protein